MNIHIYIKYINILTRELLSALQNVFHIWWYSIKGSMTKCPVYYIKVIVPNYSLIKPLYFPIVPVTRPTIIHKIFGTNSSFHVK